MTVPRPALEAKVRHIIDAVTKDPKQLEVLVRDHNQRITQANQSQMGVVQSLRTRKERVTEELARLTEAIALGGGAPKTLLTAIQEREQELEEVGTKIVEAEANVQPLLMPRAPAVEDYLTGSASLFEDDMARNRALLEQVLDCILVYASGAIVVKIKESTLFEPVNTYRLKNLGAEAADLAQARSRQQQNVAMVTEFLERHGPDRALEDADFEINKDANGSPYPLRFLDSCAH